MTSFAKLAAICCAAMLVTAAGVREPEGYRLDDYRAPVPDTISGGRVIGTPELRAMAATGGTLLIDVLPAPRRPEGMSPDAPWMPEHRRDIPGSMWLPDVGRGALKPALETWFRAKLQDLTAGDKGKPLVFYCLAQCWMSWNAAKRSISYGYTHVAWYPAGTDGWQAAGLPLAEATSSPEP